MGNYILRNDDDDGIDRRGFLKCMAWAGTGVLWVMSGGVLHSRPISRLVNATGDGAGSGSDELKGGLHFVQISDSHIGFAKEANPDVIGTLQIAVDRINALPVNPLFVLHTGDLTHLSKAPEFDTLGGVLKKVKTDTIYFVPGEHDVVGDEGKQYLERYGKGTKGSGWYSFDSKGVHFVGLVNVVNLKAGGLGLLGDDQLRWLADDLKGRSSSTPVVVFAHIPLWSVYPPWGWGTDDGLQALSYLRRFGSVSVLNGHIHQVVQKVEGNITFHTAMSTAFPQPAPGTAPSPGPMKVPAGTLGSILGITDVNYIERDHSLAIIDAPLVRAIPGKEECADTSRGSDEKTRSLVPNQIDIDNFSFLPNELVVSSGSTVTWVNRDDVPHTVVDTGGMFKSPLLDTDERFSFTFRSRGKYRYYCTIHPHMTGTIVVR